jgi:hypothetical protein
MTAQAQFLSSLAKIAVRSPSRDRTIRVGDDPILTGDGIATQFDPNTPRDSRALVKFFVGVNARNPAVGSLSDKA